MAKYELSLTSGNVFSTPVTLTVTPTDGPSVTISGSNAISTPVELAVLNSIGPRGEVGPQGSQGPQGQKGDPGETVSLQIYDGNINFGQSVQTTDDVTFNSVTTTGDVTVGGTLTGTVNGPFVGDVTVESGDTLTIDAGGSLSVPDDIISGDKVEGGTINAVTINTLTATTINVSGNVDGRDLSTDGTKLDGIEAGATADQTDAEIKTAYENNANTNAFTDADHSKLDGIEASATADQTDAEIKTAYENNANTNAFTDADHSKLDGIEAGATADQTDAEIKTAYENNANTNAFTDADHSKLDGIEANADVTDTDNVTAAGALMDSEVTNLEAVKALDQGVATTDDVTFDDLTLTGQLKGPATFTIDPAAHGDDTGTVVVAGNLQVDGTTTTINSTIVEIDDLNLKLAAEATTNAEANGAGITVGDGLANITYNSGTDRWVLDKELSADVVGTVSGDVTGNVTGNLTGSVTGTVSTLTNHTTDDLAEGTTNLYYTDARAQDAISTDATLDYLSGVVSMPSTGVTAATYGSASQVPVIAVDAQGRITSASQTNVAGVTDFDYNTSTGVLDIDTADGGNFEATVTLDPFDTDDLTEGTTNLYHTTERVQDVVGGQIVTNGSHAGISFTYDDANDGAIDATVSLASFDTDNLSEGTINLYYTDARVNSAFDTRLATKDTGDLSEGTNLYYTDARADARVAAATGVNLNLTNQDTDDLSEGTTNLYYTDARANSAFDTRLGTKDTGDLSEGTNLYYTDARADARVNLQTGANLDLSNKTTSDLTEGTNLYYTAARFDTAFGAKDTDDLSEGTTNLYYTDARDTANFNTNLAASDTDDLSEGSNLYYTDARDTANFNTNLAASDTDDLTEGTTNLYYTSTRANADFDTRLAAKTTDDLSEGLTNLYYTDARADARVNTANVTAAGALMDSEVTNLAQVKAFDSADYATAAQGALADTAVQPSDSPTFGTVTADTFSFANWTVTESGGSLYFATGGTNKMKLDASGNLQVVGNVESNATIS